jgi:hypothetical protein
MDKDGWTGVSADVNDKIRKALLPIVEKVKTMSEEMSSRTVSPRTRIWT